MEFHMYAGPPSTVADCIAMLLSRKAKLKGENPPQLSSISAHSHTRHFRLAFLAVCLSVWHLPFHLVLCFSVLYLFFDYVCPPAVLSFCVCQSVYLCLLHLLSVFAFCVCQRVVTATCFFYLCWLSVSLSGCASACPCHWSVCLPCLSYMLSVQQHKKT